MLKMGDICISDKSLNPEHLHINYDKCKVRVLSDQLMGSATIYAKVLDSPKSGLIGRHLFFHSSILRKIPQKKLTYKDLLTILNG